MKAIQRVVAVVLVAGLSFVSNAADFPAWGKKAAITFSGYTGTETLTNFPALVVLAVAVAISTASQAAVPPITLETSEKP